MDSLRVLRWLTLALCLAAVGSTATAAPPAARKADKEQARAAFLKATKHYNLSEYKEALDAFKDAYRAFEEPGILFNIAQCQRWLGQRSEAIRSYRAFLRESPNIRNRDDVEQIIAGLERSVREEEATKVRPPQGTLGADGSLGHTPPPAHIEPTAQPTNAPAVTAAVTVTQSPPPQRTPVYKKWWLWTIVGVVAVGAGVGLGLGLSQGVSYPSASTPGGRVRF